MIHNPILPDYLADPFCFYHDGWYYAVATGKAEGYSPSFDGPYVVPMVKSRDLRHWERVGRVLELTEEPYTCFWAPEVAMDDGRFYLYYHPCRAEKGGYHIRVAVADLPEGPYRDTGVPLTEPDVNPFAIDSHAFRDDDGQWYMFYATDFLDYDDTTFRGTALVVDRMTSMTELEGNPQVVMRAHWPWQRYEAQQQSHGVIADWYTLEGPTVCKRNGTYYCFYSGGCYQNDSYGVDWLEADSVLGPWREVGRERGPQLMRSVPGVIGPGHHSMVTTPEGDDYVVYHAWNKEMTDRQMCIDRLDWEGGCPSIARFGEHTGDSPMKGAGRLHAYLRALADNDWGEPSGFAGRTCFQCIPALELERRGEAPGHFRDAWIDHSLMLLHERMDCQDFSMVAFLRMLHRYPDSPLLAARRKAIEEALLGAKYDEGDSGEDTCCWLTENHQVQYASSELLAGQLWPDKTFGCTGRNGTWHRDRAEQRLRRWLDWRRRFSFSEWNSSCYYDEDLAGLLNLVEFAEDEGIRESAKAVATLLALHVAGNSWRGMTGASQGRAYLTEQIAPDETPMATLAQVCWGEGDVPARLSTGTLLLAVGDWRFPEQVSAIGRAPELERCERHSLDADEGEAFEVDPSSADNLPFFLGAGQSSHHLVVETRSAATGGREKWPGHWVDRDWYRRCKAEGRDFDTWCLPHALGRAELYTFRTPEFMLGCAQNYHPGAPGYQQFIWSASLGRRAVVFTTNPCPPDIPYGRPAPWVGNGVLPQVVQHRNVLIALHRVRPVPIYDQPPWYGEERVHAYVPRGAFAEWREESGWFFGRGEHGGYIGLRPTVAATWLPPAPAISKVIGSDEPYEWNVDATDVAWVCELGSERSHGSFEAFVEALAGATVQGDVDGLTYESPSLGRIQTGWGRGLRIAGREVSISGNPLISDAHLVVPFARQ